MKQRSAIQNSRRCIAGIQRAPAAFTLIELPAVRRRERAAFTLIELLAVIAIIAILAALLLPAMAGAMGKAKEARCVAQVKQILAARQLYTADNEGGTIPNRIDDPSSPNDPKMRRTWRWYLMDQYKIDQKIFACPTATIVTNEVGRPESFASATSDVASSYAQVGEVFGNDNKPHTFSLIAAPSRQVELIESRDYWPDMNMGSWGWLWADGYGAFGYWHSLRATAGYADGHVETKKLGATATPVCGWDTTIGPHDGTIHPEYGAMLSIYK